MTWVTFELPRAALPALARAMHAACGATVEGMADDWLYLPRSACFGVFRNRLLTEVKQSTVDMLEHDAQVAYVGLPMDWVTGYCGWIPFLGARAEIRLDGDGVSLTLSLGPATALPLGAEADVLRFAELAQHCVAAGGLSMDTGPDLPEAVAALLAPVPLATLGAR